jgi:hypothetical protein
MKELPVIQIFQRSPNCAPCPVGKSLGQRTCPGLRLRRALAALARKLWTRLFRAKR